MKLPIKNLFQALVSHWDSLDVIKKLFIGFAYMVQELDKVFLTLSDPITMPDIDLQFLKKVGFDQWDFDCFTRFNSEPVLNILDKKVDFSALPNTPLESLLPGHDQRKELLQLYLRGDFDSDNASSDASHSVTSHSLASKSRASLSHGSHKSHKLAGLEGPRNPTDL